MTLQERQEQRRSGAETTLPIPLAIYYEHPRWFEPLFAELERRDVPYLKLHADDHRFDPGSRDPETETTLFFNRMSPSAYNRGRGHEIGYTLAYLGHLERLGRRVINGEKAFRHEISKALQLSVLHSLGLPFPKTRVIHRPEDAPGAADGLRYPVVVKPNVGGSGVGIVRFDSPADLKGAALEGGLDIGPDRVGLVQEFIPARDGYITRVEGLGGRYLYAIRVHLSGETFDLCPADICQSDRAAAAAAIGDACPVEGPKNGLRVEAAQPPADVRTAVERILETTGIEIGGIEYVIDDRDGQLYFYDVNALSNFVADAPHVIGFDPFVNLVDYLLQEASRG